LRIDCDQFALHRNATGELHAQQSLERGHRTSWWNAKGRKEFLNFLGPADELNPHLCPQCREARKNHRVPGSTRLWNEADNSIVNIGTREINRGLPRAWMIIDDAQITFPRTGVRHLEHEIAGARHIP